MDLVSSYKEKLNSFRIKELKEVLSRIGLSKQGRRQDLVDRILDSLSIEVSDLQELAKENVMRKAEVPGIIDDAFRKLQNVEASSSSIYQESFVEFDNLKHEEVVQETVRCPCGSSLPTMPMIQCVDPHCGVLQHMLCVVDQEELSEEITPWRHYCEICRLNRADPFRGTVRHLLPPVKLMMSSIPHDGSNPVQNVEKTFQLSRTDKGFLCHNDYNIQAWCILLNDKVQFRMQWPLYADLKVNGVPVRTVTRPGSQLLGANGRDDGSMIAFYMVDGLNQISLSGWDARSFCLGVRIVKENTVQQLLELIHNQQEAESFEDALARVQRCIGGGMAMETEDSDSDLEVISDFVTVNLRCPMGGYRIKTAGRFRPCAHMGCFDLETFLQLNQRSRKWQCPICLKNYSLEDITVDPYLNCITKMVEDCEEDVTEIDVKFDGCWRVKKGGVLKNLDKWHLPDGSPCDITSETILNSKRVEGAVDINDFKHRKLGVNKSSNSSCESHGYGEHSANQNADLSNSDRIAKPDVGNSSASLSNLDVIFLSDSDEETATLTYPESLSKSQGVNDALSSPGIFNSFTKSLPCEAGISSALENFDNQSFSSSTQAVSQFHSIPVQPETGLSHQISNGTIAENLTPFGCGSDSGDVNGASVACNVLTSSEQDFAKRYESNEDLSVNKRVKSELAMDTKLSNDPFSFPRRARSSRQRYIP